MIILLSLVPESWWGLFLDLHCENLVRFLKGASKNYSPQEFLILVKVYAQSPAVYQNCHLIVLCSLWLQLQISVVVSVLVHLSLQISVGRLSLYFCFPMSPRKYMDFQFVQLFLIRTEIKTSKIFISLSRYWKPGDF